MSSVMLALTNHAFTSSIWSGCAYAPCDLLLATEDGSVGAHCGMLLPMSRYLASAVEDRSSTGPTQVVLMGASIKAVAAVKELVYTGTCHLDKVSQLEESVAEILETMRVLGIEVSTNSFSLETELPTSDNNQGSGQDVPGAEVKFEAKGDVLKNVKVEAGDYDQLMIRGRGENLGKVTFLSSGFEQIWKEEFKVRNPELTMKEEFCVEENVHINKKAIACYVDGCKVELASIDSLKGHIRNVHKKTKPHQCNLCLKKFKKRHNLRRHIDDVHHKLKSYQCEEAGCAAKFKSKDWLNNHVRTVHWKERSHPCPQPGCSEKFGMKLNLKRHMMKVHNFEKPHSCVEKNCGLRFEERRQLENHLRSVHGAKKLACDIENCTLTFLSTSGLNMHKKKHKQTSDLNNSMVSS